MESIYRSLVVLNGHAIDYAMTGCKHIATSGLQYPHVFNNIPGSNSPLGKNIPGTAWYIYR